MVTFPTGKGDRLARIERQSIALPAPSSNPRTGIHREEISKKRPCADRVSDIQLRDAGDEAKARTRVIRFPKSNRTVRQSLPFYPALRPRARPETSERDYVTIFGIYLHSEGDQLTVSQADRRMNSCYLR